MQHVTPKENCKEMEDRVILEAPFTDDKIKSLKAGDMVYISGTVYTGRDAAHKRLAEMIERGEKMPFDFEGQAIYYAGPCPAKPGKPIGSVGPTTGGRMDAYSPLLIQKGLRVMIGKGSRSKEVIDALKEHTGVYFAAIGGAAALMARCVVSAEVIAFDELGTEAIRKLQVDQLPVIVAIDSEGNDSYELGRSKYSQK
jgi:fumarate hydratase subunit beta